MASDLSPRVTRSGASHGGSADNSGPIVEKEPSLSPSIISFRAGTPSFGFSYSTPCASGIWLGSSDDFDTSFQPNCGKPWPILRLQLGTNHPSKRSLLLVKHQQVGLPVNLQAPRSTVGSVVPTSAQSQHQLETVRLVAAQRQDGKRGPSICELGPVGSTCSGAHDTKTIQVCRSHCVIFDSRQLG